MAKVNSTTSTPRSAAKKTTKRSAKKTPRSATKKTTKRSAKKTAGTPVEPATRRSLSEAEARALLNSLDEASLKKLLAILAADGLINVPR